MKHRKAFLGAVFAAGVLFAGVGVDGAANDFLSSRVVAAEIRGYVFYADGETPAAGVPVRIWDVEEQEFIQEVDTDKNGFYRFSKLQPGRYYLTFDWTKIELLVVEAAGGLAQQPHDVIAIIPRGLAYMQLPQLMSLMLITTLAEGAALYEEYDRPSIVSP